MEMKRYYGLTIAWWGEKRHMMSRVQLNDKSDDTLITPNVPLSSHITRGVTGVLGGGVHPSLSHTHPYLEPLLF